MLVVPTKAIHLPVKYATGSTFFKVSVLVTGFNAPFKTWFFMGSLVKANIINRTEGLQPLNGTI